MKIDVVNFEDRAPKRGKVICFSEKNADAAFYLLDGKGNVWGFTQGDDEWHYACPADELSKYGHYSHWARTDQGFDIKYNIPKEA